MIIDFTYEELLELAPELDEISEIPMHDITVEERRNY